MGLDITTSRLRFTGLHQRLLPRRRDINPGIVHYDIRSDALPYDDETVSNVYASHVIEHVESEHVERFLVEAHRVLKPGGVLRIACPDARFLYEVSSFENDYWKWRRDQFEHDERYEVQGERHAI